MPNVIEPELLQHLIMVHQLELNAIGKLPTNVVKTRLNRSLDDFRQLAPVDLAEAINQPPAFVSTQAAHLAEQVALAKADG